METNAKEMRKLVDLRIEKKRSYYESDYVREMRELAELRLEKERNHYKNDVLDDIVMRASYGFSTTRCEIPYEFFDYISEMLVERGFTVQLHYDYDEDDEDIIFEVSW